MSLGAERGRRQACGHWVLLNAAAARLHRSGLRLMVLGWGTSR